MWFKNFLKWLASIFSPKPGAPYFPPVASTPTPPEKTSPITFPMPSGELSYGPDESHWEPNINFAELATDNVFTATKATQGTNYVDGLFSKYWPAMKAAGLIRIAFHFYDPTVDPIKQAQHFLKVVGPIGPRDILAVDFEDLPAKGVKGPTEKSAEDVETFCKYVDAQMRQTTIVYANYDYLNNYSCTKILAKRPIWLAYPERKVVAIPKGFSHPAIWQYTFKGTYKGVPQKIDGNIFFGSRAEMIQWIDSLKIRA